jgi:xylulokinase
VHGASRLAALGLPARELRVVGGGSRNALWRRILADAFGVPLRFPAEPESAALGAALQAAAVASGTTVAAFVRAHRPPMSPEVVDPIDANVRAYRDLAARFDALGERLFGAVTSR